MILHSPVDQKDDLNMYIPTYLQCPRAATEWWYYCPNWVPSGQSPRQSKREGGHVKGTITASSTSRRLNSVCVAANPLYYVITPTQRDIVWLNQNSAGTQCLKADFVYVNLFNGELHTSPPAGWLGPQAGETELWGYSCPVMRREELVNVSLDDTGLACAQVSNDQDLV